MTSRYCLKLFLILTVLMGLFLLWTPSVLAADGDHQTEEEIFEARILEILEQKEINREDGSKLLQQNVKARSLTGNWKDKEFVVDGISTIEVLSANVYEPGDRVVVNYSPDIDGQTGAFYIVDFVRRPRLYLLVLFFILLVVAISRWKGVKSIISLAITFLVIMKFIVPQILNGGSPLLIGVVGSFVILMFIIYLTEGFNKKSHLAILSILFSLLITSILSIIFSAWLKLTGMAQEEAMYLIGLTKKVINFEGLLLAGVLIGTLGVLDDVVISQIEAVKQIKIANSDLSKKRILKMSFDIGNAHIGAVVNTLFLAYAGASLPLLLLFSLQQPPFETFREVINNELIATEIMRALIGSVGLVLAMPITTLLAVYFYNGKEKI